MTEPRRSTRGTYTFLFTDIEGSTSLEAADRTRPLPRSPASAPDADARRPGQTYRWCRAGHRGRLILRRLPRGTRGGRGRRRGPARAGHARPWPDDAPIRVRMGLNIRWRRADAGDSLRRAQHQSGGADRRGRPRRPDPGLRADPRPACTDHPLDGDLPARPRRASAQGPERRRSASSRSRPTACRPSLPAAAHARRAPEQPADPADDVHRPRRRAGGGGRPAGDDPPADPHRTRAGRARPACRSSSRRVPPTTSPTASSSCPSSRSATRCWSRRGSRPRSASPRRAPGRSPTRSPTGCATSGCCSCSTTSSRSCRPRRSSPTCCGPRRTSRSSSPAGRCSTSRASRSTPSRACRRRRTRAT